MTKPTPLEERLTQALGFYASPETYFAIGFFPDPPCGDFVDDFSEDYDHDFMEGPRPGKRAREALFPNGENSEVGKYIS